MAEPSRSFSLVADLHRRGNREAKGDWTLYAEHRARLTALITEAAGQSAAPAGPLCLLGAGNCNDVDLESLAATFAEIHLVDIDPAALARARERLAPGVRERVVLHGGIDLTGMLGHLDVWKGRAPDAATMAGAVDRGVAEICRGLPVGRCRVAVSCCLMSQLGWSLETGLGEGQSGGAATVELRLATIAVHLRTLAHLCHAQGMAVLANDIVSSELYPLDELPPDVDLRDLADRLVSEQQVVFAGANPLLIGRVLRRDPFLRTAFSQNTMADPWIWHGRLELAYLVYPQVLRRATDQAGVPERVFAPGVGGA